MDYTFISNRAAAKTHARYLQSRSDCTSTVGLIYFIRNNERGNTKINIEHRGVISLESHLYVL
jgi:hypothetical protein